MLVRQSSSPGQDGPGGVALAAEAEKMVALLWQQALTGLSKTAMTAQGSGTGSSLYISMALHAVSEKLFANSDPTLVKSIQRELTATAAPAIAKHATPPAALAVLQSLPSGAQEAAQTAAPPALVTDQGSFLNQAVSFARKVWPAIETAAQAIGAPPVALLAQSALETGWGASAPGNNLFGVKATAGQASSTAATSEYLKGVVTPVVAQFAAYPSVSSAVEQFTALIKQNFSSAVGTKSVEGYASALASSGYATDPGYVGKIVDVAQSAVMHEVMGQLGISSSPGQN